LANAVRQPAKLSATPLADRFSPLAAALCKLPMPCRCEQPLADVAAKAMCGTRKRRARRLSGGQGMRALNHCTGRCRGDTLTALPHGNQRKRGREGDMSSASAGIVTYRGAVYASHCDHIGHMNIAAYGAKFDEATWVLFCEIGLTPSYLRGERHGMAGVQQNLTYSRELFAGDVIEIRSRVLEVTDRRLKLRHEMRNIETGELASTCEITALHLDKAAHRSCPLPPAVRAAAEAVMAGSR
jgi:acyl-CoA thioester hydrolase